MVMIDMIHEARGSLSQSGWSSILKIDAILFLYHWLVSQNGILRNLGMIDMMHETSGSPTQIFGWSSIIEIDATLLLLACVTERKLGKPGNASHGCTCHPLWLFGSIHEKLPDMCSTRSGEGCTSNVTGVDSDDILQTPLISRQTTSLEKDIMGSTRGTFLRMWRHSNLMQRACYYWLVSWRKLDKPGHASHGSTCNPLWHFGSIHEKLPDMGSTRSMLFPNFGSMFSMAEHPPVKNKEWDVKSQIEGEGEGYTSNVTDVDLDDMLQTHSISRQTTSLEKDIMGPTRGTFLRMWRSFKLMQRAEAGCDPSMLSSSS